MGSNWKWRQSRDRKWRESQEPETISAHVQEEKSAGGNDVISSYDVSSGHVNGVTSGYSVTSSHVTDITSGYGFTSGHMTDVTSGSTEQQPQYSQSNDEKPYYILKTNNPCFLVLGTSML